MRSRNNEDACCKLCAWEYDGESGCCLPGQDDMGDFNTFACGGDYEDAAKFEALVAKELTALDYEDVPCAHGMGFFCPKPPFAGNDCARWCLLREARLKVERTM